MPNNGFEESPPTALSARLGQDRHPEGHHTWNPLMRARIAHNSAGIIEEYP